MLKSYCYTLFYLHWRVFCEFPCIYGFKPGALAKCKIRPSSLLSLLKNARLKLKWYISIFSIHSKHQHWLLQIYFLLELTPMCLHMFHTITSLGKRSIARGICTFVWSFTWKSFQRIESIIKYDKRLLSPYPLYH